MNRPRSLVAAVAGPVLAALAVVPVRGAVTPVNVALMLVLVVVAVAATGHRLAGVVAALSAAVAFDFFFVPPYGTLTIDHRADAETALLLLGVGLGVAELASRGRRQETEVSRLAGYQAGLRAALDGVADQAAPGVVVEQVARQIGELLGARCRFDYGTGVIGGAAPRLRPDGEVEVRGRRRDVEADGLPCDTPTEILVSSSGRYLGRFVLVAGVGARPALAQRLAAVTLADRAAEALATS